jgi:Fe-S oxidoreductase
VTATREVYWNISHTWVMYVLLVPTLLMAAYGVYRRVRRWRLGHGRLQFDRPVERLRRVLSAAIAQKPIWRRPLVGAFHSMLFWGFMTLTAATIVVFLDHDFNIPIMQGRFYLYFQSLFVDLMGALALIGCLVAGARRWIGRPKELVFSDQATWILVAFIVILGSGFLLEGWRIAATDDPWGSWSPVGYLVARTSSMVASTSTLQTAHVVLWWAHLLLVFGLIAWAPYTKLLHVVTSTLNIFAADLDSRAGSLKKIDFDTAETFGVNQLDQFASKDLLDLDACTECGRCESVCPANTVGKLLSPRDVILDLRKQLSAHDGKSVDSRSSGIELIGSQPALAPEALWQCTTCAACVEACPVAIEQYPKIVDMRRYLVMEEAEFPRQMQEAMTSLEQRGHPFRGAQASRTDWTEGLEISHISDVDRPEILLWVGCGGALVERNQKTTRAVAQLLQHAGVRFGILGKDETCTGDPARRIGNEFLFDTLAQRNVKAIDAHLVDTIVTSCPHCFHTFKNEYPQLGGHWQVFHHSTYLAKLIGEGRISVSPSDSVKLTLHDPCYLGRHNGITDEPRQILDAVSGSASVEMPRHGKQSFCCGGGGGLSFVDEPSGQRVNVERATEAVDTGAETVAVACPFCTTMLEDGIGAVQGNRKVQVKDVAELLWASVEESKQRK